MRILLRALLFLGILLIVLAMLVTAIFHDRRPPVYFAAERGDTNAIAEYLAKGSNVNALIDCTQGKQYHAPKDLRAHVEAHSICS